MTDQIFYEELRATIRDAIASYLDTYTDEELRELATESLNLPSRPTLADMTDDERNSCTGMQADEATGERVIVIDGTDRPDGRVEVLHGEIYVYYPLATDVTPRPDLPRLEWPSTGQDGEEATKVDYVSVAGGRTAYGPWTVARLRKNPAPAPAPPNTLTEGSEWDNVDALARACEESGRTQITVIDRDGDVSVWDASAENWHGPHPIPKYAPFTITHTGRKANQ